MKKYCIVLFPFILLLSFPTAVSAEELNETMIVSGYTEEGIYYEVYGTLYNRSSSDSITVTRNIVYDSNITPNTQISWKEKINNVSYSGILRLLNYNYDAPSNKTTAIYYGTLTAD